MTDEWNGAELQEATGSGADTTVTMEEIGTAKDNEMNIEMNTSNEKRAETSVETEVAMEDSEVGHRHVEEPADAEGQPADEHNDDEDNEETNEGEDDDDKQGPLGSPVGQPHHYAHQQHPPPYYYPHPGTAPPQGPDPSTPGQQGYPHQQPPPGYPGYPPPPGYYVPYGAVPYPAYYPPPSGYPYPPHPGYPGYPPPGPYVDQSAPSPATPASAAQPSYGHSSTEKNDDTGDEDDPVSARLKTYIKPRIPSTQEVLDRRARKNAQSRARAAKLRQRISEIEQKPEEERTEEEMHIWTQYEQRRSRKNDRSRERALEKKEEIDRILAKPDKKRTKIEKQFLETALSAKKRKNEGDRLRRQRLKDLGLSTKGTGVKPGVSARGPLPSHYAQQQQQQHHHHYPGPPMGDIQMSPMPHHPHMSPAGYHHPPPHHPHQSPYHPHHPHMPPNYGSPPRGGPQQTGRHPGMAYMPPPPQQRYNVTSPARSKKDSKNDEPPESPNGDGDEQQVVVKTEL